MPCVVAIGQEQRCRIETAHGPAIFLALQERDAIEAVRTAVERRTLRSELIALGSTMVEKKIAFPTRQP